MTIKSQEHHAHPNTDRYRRIHYTKRNELVPGSSHALHSEGTYDLAHLVAVGFALRSVHEMDIVRWLSGKDDLTHPPNPCPDSVQYRRQLDHISTTQTYIIRAPSGLLYRFALVPDETARVQNNEVRILLTRRWQELDRIIQVPCYQAPVPIDKILQFPTKHTSSGVLVSELHNTGMELTYQNDGRAVVQGNFSFPQYVKTSEKGKSSKSTLEFAEVELPVSITVDSLRKVGDDLRYREAGVNATLAISIPRKKISLGYAHSA